MKAINAARYKGLDFRNFIRFLPVVFLDELSLRVRSILKVRQFGRIDVSQATSDWEYKIIRGVLSGTGRAKRL
jgi:hypothetical protein